MGNDTVDVLHNIKSSASVILTMGNGFFVYICIYI